MSPFWRFYILELKLIQKAQLIKPIQNCFPFIKLIQKSQMQFYMCVNNTITLRFYNILFFFFDEQILQQSLSDSTTFWAPDIVEGIAFHFIKYLQGRKSRNHKANKILNNLRPKGLKCWGAQPIAFIIKSGIKLRCQKEVPPVSHKHLYLT